METWSEEWHEVEAEVAVHVCVLGSLSVRG